MNRISFRNNHFELLETDDLISVSLSDKFELFDIKNIVIDCIGNTELEIIYENSKETKLDIEYNISSNCNLKVVEIRKEKKIKIQYKYNLDKNAKLKVIKFYNVKEAKELDIVSLNGENAEIDYLFKTIVPEKHKYDIYVYHNFPKTKSNIINNALNIDNGTTIINVTSVVYTGIKKCELNQIDKVVNLNDRECIVKPNLLIDEEDTINNYETYIGKFNSKSLEVLISKGKTKEEAIEILKAKFLYEGINGLKLKKRIDKYWR